MRETKYHKKVKNKRIAIFGITPPPLGGVSIHIQRITREFKKNKNQVYHVRTDFRGRKYLLPVYLLYVTLFLLWKKIDILYYHSLYQPNSILEIYFLVWLKKTLNYKIILVEHNCRHMYKRNKKSIKSFNKIIKNIDKIVFMGNSPYQSYKENNICIPSNSLIDKAFLPPENAKEKEILKQHPKELDRFITNHHPVLLVNASRIAIFENKDLYGLDRSVQVLTILKKDYPNIGLIIALANISDTIYVNKIIKKINTLNLKNNIFLLTGNHKIWPLFKKIDIFLRPTQCDGASISLQEALFFGAQVVASNVCRRPKKTIVFDIESQDDFIDKINLAIHSLRFAKQITTNDSKKVTKK